MRERKKKKDKKERKERKYVEEKKENVAKFNFDKTSEQKSLVFYSPKSQVSNEVNAPKGPVKFDY